MSSWCTYFSCSAQFKPKTISNQRAHTQRYGWIIIIANKPVLRKYAVFWAVENMPYSELMDCTVISIGQEVLITSRRSENCLASKVYTTILQYSIYIIVIG